MSSVLHYLVHVQDQNCQISSPGLGSRVSGLVRGIWDRLTFALMMYHDPKSNVLCPVLAVSLLLEISVHLFAFSSS